jgi:hypothetical protein
VINGPDDISVINGDEDALGEDILAEDVLANEEALNGGDDDDSNS